MSIRYTQTHHPVIARAFTLGFALAAMSIAPQSASAQEHVHKPGMVHTPGMTPPAPSVLPTHGGQAAFAAIGEIIKLLEADSATDWKRVNLERLRLHLIDMDLVTMRSTVASTNVPGGASFTVRGTGATVAAIQRMTRAHVNMVAAENGPKLTRVELPDGARLTVTATDASDAKAVVRIRALGFIGLMASGDHHAAHHIMIARGDAMADHGH